MTIEDICASIELNLMHDFVFPMKIDHRFHATNIKKGVHIFISPRRFHTAVVIVGVVRVVFSLFFFVWHVTHNCNRFTEKMWCIFFFSSVCHCLSTFHSLSTYVMFNLSMAHTKTSNVEFVEADCVHSYHVWMCA